MIGDYDMICKDSHWSYRSDAVMLIIQKNAEINVKWFLNKYNEILLATSSNSLIYLSIMVNSDGK